jgi:hypothetical protein
MPVGCEHGPVAVDDQPERCDVFALPDDRLDPHDRADRDDRSVAFKGKLKFRLVRRPRPGFVRATAVRL